MVDLPPPLPSVPPDGFMCDGVTCDAHGDILPDLAVQEDDDNDSMCPPVAGTARIVTDEKSPWSPPGMSLQDPILAAAYGGTLMKTNRKRYCVKDKLNVLKKVKQMMDSDKVSFRAAAAKLSLDSGMVTRWKRDEDKLNQASSKKMKSMHTGRKPQLEVDDVEKELLSWVFEQRQQGLAVSNVSVLIKAASLSRTFRQKSYIAQYSAVARFVKKYGLVYRLGTRQSQRSRDEVDTEGRAWVREISEKL
jgi:hypothetical protein